jgi:hypothetical protein
MIFHEGYHIIGYIVFVLAHTAWFMYSSVIYIIPSGKIRCYWYIRVKITSGAEIQLEI